MLWSNGVEFWYDQNGVSQFDSSGAIEALSWVHGTMYTENVAFPPEIRQRVAGEFGDPFSAGQVGLWPGGRVYSTGFGIPRIKDRFTWSVAPMYAAPSTGEVRHGWNDQPHIVTIAAERLGNLEQTVQLVTYLAGPEYQARVGIDRGHFPVFKEVADQADALAAPPEGMHWLKTYATTPEPRTPGYFPVLGRVHRRVPDGGIQALGQRGWSRASRCQDGRGHQRHLQHVRRLDADSGLVFARSSNGPPPPAAGRLAFPHGRLLLAQFVLRSVRGEPGRSLSEARVEPHPRTYARLLLLPYPSSLTSHSASLTTS